MVTQEYFPNSKVVHTTTSSAVWSVVASDGTLYTTLALMVAAGKSAFPGVGLTGLPGVLVLRTEDGLGSGVAGSPVYFATNQASAPTDDTGQLIDGGGQQFGLGTSIWNLWVRKVTAADEVICTFMY